MPSMDEIYQSHGDQYDRLVSREDWQGNLSRLLNQILPPGLKTSLELGVGTGRVTKIYHAKVQELILADRSAHMLERARVNLSSVLQAKLVEYVTLDNLGWQTFSGPQVDLLIEGWSFGHTVLEGLESAEQNSDIMNQLIEGWSRHVKPRGYQVIIETMGSGVTEPQAPHDGLATFYRLLETLHGFTYHLVSTDYRFSTKEEAQEVMSFFFGDWILPAISGPQVPEFTGVWVRQV